MWLFPGLPWETSVTIVNGDQEEIFPFPEVDKQGKVKSSLYPTVLVRSKFFENLAEDWELQIGGSAGLGWRNRRRNLHSQLFGGDFFLRYRPLKRSRYQSLLLQGELYYTKKQGRPTSSYALALYVTVQYQFSRHLYLGAKYDFSEDLETSHVREYRISAYISYYTTEFLRLRIGYQYHSRNRGFADTHSVIFQVTFVFGSHPVEPYWVNR